MKQLLTAAVAVVTLKTIEKKNDATISPQFYKWPLSGIIS